MKVDSSGAVTPAPVVAGTRVLDMSEGSPCNWFAEH